MDRIVQGEPIDIRVPPQDGSIAQALAELDDKVAAWGDAMCAAESSLADMAANCRSQAKAADTSEEAQTVPVSAESEPCVAAFDPGVDSVDVADAVEPVVETVVAPAVEPAIEPVAEVAEVEPEAAPDPDMGASEDEDAALLATLDPETSNAIRVMRRLAPVKISVRELLEEYEASKANEHMEQPRKKSWFWK